MQHLKTLVVALGVALWLPMQPMPKRAAEPAVTPAESADKTATPGKRSMQIVPQRIP